MLNECGIYKILNTITKDVYYGSTRSFKERWAEHKTMLKHNKHPNIFLQRAWNKYGEDQFEFSVVLICVKEDCLYHTYWDNCIHCYNISKDATSPMKGRITSSETKEKLSKALSGSIPWNKGKQDYFHHSAEHKNKLQQAYTKFITFGGETLSLGQWANKLGINKSALCYRLAKWPIEKALTTPKTNNQKLPSAT